LAFKKNAPRQALVPAAESFISNEVGAGNITTAVSSQTDAAPTDTSSVLVLASNLTLAFDLGLV
jgi:hypothetical protein